MMTRQCNDLYKNVWAASCKQNKNKNQKQTKKKAFSGICIQTGIPEIPETVLSTLSLLSLVIAASGVRPLTCPSAPGKLLKTGQFYSPPPPPQVKYDIFSFDTPSPHSISLHWEESHDPITDILCFLWLLSLFDLNLASATLRKKQDCKAKAA